MMKCPHCDVELDTKKARSATREFPLECQCGTKLWFKAPNGLGFLFVGLYTASLAVAEFFGKGGLPYWGILVSGSLIAIAAERYLESRFGRMVTVSLFGGGL